MFGFFERALKKSHCLIKAIPVSDLETFSRLVRQTYQQTYHAYVITQGEEAVEKKLEALYPMTTLQRWLTDPQFCALGLYQSENEDLLGYALIEFDNRGATLSKIYLSQAAQGIGLGRLLMEACFHTLRKKPEIEQFRLEVWEKNEKAKRFYERMGFSNTNEKIRYPHASEDESAYDDVYVKRKKAFIG